MVGLRAGVLGWPLARTLSPVLHGTWIEALGLDARYAACPVKPEDLAATLDALAAQGWAGVNLTMPHKEAGAAWVRDRGGRLSDRATAMEAVNAISFGAIDEVPWGDNFDAEGLTRALEAVAPGVLDKKGVRAVVLGMGGAARAAVWALTRRGLAVSLVCRRVAAGAALLRQLAFRQESAQESAQKSTAIAWQDRLEALKGAEVVINATPLGGADAGALDVSLEGVAAGAAVLDMVYTPRATPLLAEARARGLRAAEGLDMLVYQAVPSFAAFYGATPDAAAIARAWRAAAL